jgi:hypothetical protein
MIMKLKDQAVVFFETIQTRQRHPVRSSTLAAYRTVINNWIIPSIGEENLETFGNGALKIFVHKLVVLHKSPATIRLIINVVKMIVASAVTFEGEQIYPRTWNAEFLDIPDIGPQKSPMLTQTQLRAALRSKYAVFFAVLAGTGLRIGEALAIRYGDDGTHTAWDPENAVILVRTTLWRGKEGPPKTLSGLRQVDLDPRLNTLLRETYDLPVGTPLFHRANGKFLFQSYLYETGLKPLNIKGFHTFRRYRITRLRELGVPEDVIRYWAGHAGGSITDRYSRLAQDKELRKQWAVRAGLGFELPEIRELYT